jgi:hypothetical protein
MRSRVVSRYRDRGRFQRFLRRLLSVECRQSRLGLKR